MTEPLFVSTTFLEDGSPLFEALNLCKRLDIEGVELGSNHCFEKDYSYIQNYEFRLLTHNYFPIPEDDFVVNIASKNEDIRQRSLQHARTAIDFSDDAGAEIYTLHPGFITDPAGKKRSLENYDFEFGHADIRGSAHKLTTELMFKSLDELVKYAQKRSVKLAIETEGSVNHHNQLIMQTLEEYEILFEHFNSDELGLNLNIGHLNLASKYFDFDAFEFAHFIQPSVVAMELSHNFGQNDDHLPLQRGAWYWPLIFSEGFNGIPRILEFRQSTREKLEASISLFRSYQNEIV